MKVTGFSISDHFNYLAKSTISTQIFQGGAMLSKCANPECSEPFRYLHQGKMFCLMPTPKAAATSYGSLEFLYERFWLCDRCSKEMKVTWDGARARVVRLTAKDPDLPPSPGTEARSPESGALAAQVTDNHESREASVAVASWHSIVAAIYSPKSLLARC